MSESIPPEEQEEPEAGSQTVDEVTMEGGEVNFGDFNGEVTGDILRGGIVRGQGHVSVKGNVLGDPKGGCEIDVSETVVLEKNIQNATVKARHIVILGDVLDSEVHSDLGVEVRGGLVGSSVSLGCRTGEIQTLKCHRVDFKSVHQELSEIEVRLGSAGRHFVRDYHQVNLKLGNILIPTQRELKIDLAPFYKALGTRTPAEIDKALQEFYLRVIVGMLTRANKQYVSQNPSRHKIFLKVIEELRGHFMVVRRADALREKMEQLKNTKADMLEKLNQPVPFALKVGGEVSGECRVRALSLSDVHDSASGAVAMDETWAETKLQPAGDGWELETWSLSGKKSILPAEDPLKKGRFELQSDSISWIPS
jgi:hypothetical protein